MKETGGYVPGMATWRGRCHHPLKTEITKIGDPVRTHVCMACAMLLESDFDIRPDVDVAPPTERT